MWTNGYISFRLYLVWTEMLAVECYSNKGRWLRQGRWHSTWLHQFSAQDLTGQVKWQPFAKNTNCIKASQALPVFFMRQRLLRLTHSCLLDAWKHFLEMHVSFTSKSSLDDTTVPECMCTNKQQTRMQTDFNEIGWNLFSTVLWWIKQFAGARSG